MFIAISKVNYGSSGAECAAQMHRAPLERGPEAAGGYKHLAAPRPTHYHPTTQLSRGYTR